MKYLIKRELHTDFSVFEQNKRPARSYFIPFSSAERLGGTDYKNERYLSDRVTVLSGEWDFAYFKKLSLVPETVDTENQAFDKITVPCTWQRTGYDQIAYINTRYPFPKKPPHIPADVAAGIYRKRFSLDGERHILSFLGIAGAAAVYVNGKYVGYSEGSHNTAEFDISSCAVKGENELVVVVYKWSNGTYLECQDMFRENGIFRDVLVFSRGESYIDDFCLRTLDNKNGTYNLKISAAGEFAPDCRIKVSGRDKSGAELFCTELLPEKKALLSELSVSEWSAEVPNVYEVTFSLFSGGNEIEAFRTYLGFRHIEIDGEVFKLNGRAIKIKGVNHHDTHMTKGYAMGIEDMEKDVRLMKEYNCNAVRTSHYPPDPAFLLMCDIYGLYVIDEADIETHGFYSVPGTYRPGRLSNNLKWASHYLDRVSRMYERDKNHPSVTMWSLGNESGGYKCQDVCYDFLKKVNPQIPVHYEGVNRSKRWAYDVVSHMYATPGLMRKVLGGTAGSKYKGKPFFQCEYAHAMGNGPGGLEEYMQLFYSSQQFMGGCIWEWADHSVYDENAKYKWTYGGDHNEPIHDGNFCVDGLFFPDREPSSGALEMKAVYRPLRAKYTGNGRIELWNTRSFSDSSDIEIAYQLLSDGKIVREGKIEADVKPGERLTVCVPELSKPLGGEGFVNLIYTEKESGFEIAREQLELGGVRILPKETAQKPADASVSGDDIVFGFESGKAVFHRKKGLTGYCVNGKEMLLENPLDAQHGFVPHIYRGMIDNDRNLMVFWRILGLDSAEARLVSCKVKKDNDGVFVRCCYNFVTRAVFVLAKSVVDYRIYENGEMNVTASLKQVCPLTAELPRFGVHGELSADLTGVRYYGRGPEESYCDFKEHTTVGIFETEVKKMAHKYIKPQDSGNRTEVRFAELKNAGGQGVRFSAKNKPISFNANPFTLGQLKKARHIEDLPDCETAFVSVDGFTRGTGSGSCGPAPSKEHKIAFGFGKPLSFTFTVKPL